MLHHRKSIPLNDLLLDLENSRHGVQPDQSAALRWMITGKSKAKVMNLARSIALHGPSPSELPIVIPAGNGQEELYKVIEGNRRVAVLKMLHDPQRCPDEQVRGQFRKLQQEAQVSLPAVLECVVFPDFPSAARWIELRHLGEQGGAGIVGWGAKESDQFAKRIGRQGRYDPAMQLLEYATENRLITQEESDGIPITNLTRLINSPNVRRELGLTLSRGELSRVAPRGYVNRVVGDLLRTLATGLWTVSDLKSKDQRRRFIEIVKGESGWGSYEVQSELPLAAKEVETLPPDETASNSEGKKGEKQKRTSRNPLSRHTAISSSTSMKIQHKRLLAIFRELKDLDADSFVNAASLLTRLFIEGCVAQYLENNTIQVQGNVSLAEKVKKVREHMIQAHTSMQVKIRDDLKGLEVFSGDHHSIGSANTFNAVVHNLQFTLTAKELKQNWDRLEPCLRWFEGHV